MSNHCFCGLDETLTLVKEPFTIIKCVITNHLLSVCCSHSQEVVHESRLKPTEHRNPFILWKPLLSPSLQIWLRQDTGEGQANHHKRLERTQSCIQGKMMDFKYNYYIIIVNNSTVE